MTQALRDIPGPKADEIRQNLVKLGALLPETYPFTFYEISSPTELKKSDTVVSGAKVTKRDFSGVLDYLNYGQKTIKNIERYLAQPKAIQGAEKAALDADLRAAREAMDKVNNDFGRQPALAEAVDFVFLGYE